MRRTQTGKWLALVTAIWLVGCGARRPAANSVDVATGIIGGSDVPSTHPLVRSVVGIYLAGSWCTGILLPDNLVLTAAHCVTDPSKMIVFFGATLGSQSPRARVDGVKVSPNWGAPHADGKNDGDIALLHFAGQAPAGVIPLPILPPEKQALFPAGTPILIAGYGFNDDVRKTGGGVLRMVTARLGNPRFSPTEILIDQTQGKGACHGDSGGPALVFVNNQPYVWGVTSRGMNEAKSECDQLALSTNAPMWKAWIDRDSETLLRETKNGGRNNSFSHL